jgi:hypothetical protein
MLTFMVKSGAEYPLLPEYSKASRYFTPVVVGMDCDIALG